MKLYWRYKKDGAWTWKAACSNMIHIEGHVIDCECSSMEEEEWSAHVVITIWILETTVSWCILWKTQTWSTFNIGNAPNVGRKSHVEILLGIWSNTLHQMRIHVLRVLAMNVRECSQCGFDAWCVLDNYQYVCITCQASFNHRNPEDYKWWWRKSMSVVDAIMLKL